MAEIRSVKYIHGDQGYDDSVEVLVANSTTSKRYMPVIDEAGTGSIEAVLDGATGDVVERVLYGDAPRYLLGPAVIEQRASTAVVISTL